MSPLPARRDGVSSRLRRAPGPRTPWTAANGAVVDLPVVLDVGSYRADGSCTWLVEATVALVDGEPRVTRVEVADDEGLDLTGLQAQFRWSTPLEAVTITVPLLLARGRDPFEHDYAVRGYPDVARMPHGARPMRLTDEFLADIARLYVSMGRGYAERIAALYSVSPRTAVSWVEKARARGILTPTRAGAVGGTVVTGRATS